MSEAPARGTLSLTRRVTFTAAHRYQRPEWSAAQNAERFGKALMEFHSHDYLCDVTVSGAIDETTGTIVDLGLLDRVLRAEVVERFDQRRLNVDVEEFAGGGQMPTGENLARLIAHRVQRALDEAGAGVAVTEVTVAEDPTLSSTWRRDGVAARATKSPPGTRAV